MELQTKTVELRIITANEGMVLTDGETYSSIGGQVYLGVNDKAENWHEITEEEYQKIIEEQEKLALLEGEVE